MNETCDAVRAETKDGKRCGAPATRIVTWQDGATSPACQECAMLIEQVAQAHGTRVRVERHPSRR